MSEAQLFLGGRYFAEYFYLTCSMMNFCCNSTLPSKWSQELGSYLTDKALVCSVIPCQSGQTWEIKNADSAFFGNRYESCWEGIDEMELWNKWG